jgi:hypothetical protein
MNKSFIDFSSLTFQHISGKMLINLLQQIHHYFSRFETLVTEFVTFIHLQVTASHLLLWILPLECLPSLTWDLPNLTGHPPPHHEPLAQVRHSVAGWLQSLFKLLDHAKILGCNCI